MEIHAIQTNLFREGEKLLPFILPYVSGFQNGDVLVVASKIVALSQKRTAVCITQREKDALVQAESDRAIPTKYVWLTLKDGIGMASAGIDESNGDGKLILAPEKIFSVAKRIRKGIKNVFNVRDVGVIIADSCPIPLRKGVIGVALGYAGFRGVKSYAGQKDLFGRNFTFSSVNIADSLATSTTLLMGEGDEQQPLAIIRSAPVEFCAGGDSYEMRIDPEDDMFAPLLQHFL